ncbi:hypothetical protein HY620_02965 [Candidatus Uhrbacteria bacterium]|nr:hypothetical protein [Candidatus Uhrbacteria bacterium]
MTLTENIKRYLTNKEEKKAKVSGESMIVVNEAVGAIAFYYEKIRNVIDYADEHLLRQNAILRILGRRLILQQDTNDLAMGILRELVRSRYFPNNSVPQKTVKDVEKILQLYLGVIRSLKSRRILSDKDQDWLLSMAACAIDEHLASMKQEEALVQLMYEKVEKNVVVKGNEEDDATRKSQLYIAAYRILLRPDIHRLRYFLLKQIFPVWQNLEHVDIEARAAEYHDVASKIDYHIKHQLNKKFMNQFRRFRIPFIVLYTLLKNNPDSILSERDALEKEVKRLCEGFYNVQRRRLYSRGIRAFVYIFLTKMVLGLAIELPYDIFALGHINTLPLMINVFFPPILLAAIAFTVRFPGETNTIAIQRAVNEIVFEDTPHEIFTQQKAEVKKRPKGLYAIFTLLYIVLFAVSFGAVGWVLWKLHFNIVSGVIFFLFFSLITFFGITLRRQVRELVILKAKPSLLAIFVESFFLPIIKVGHWLSFNISRVNIFVFIFDILIELPLQAFIEITEEWFAFLKEKKDETE